MPLGNGGTKYGISWEGKQNHELWKQYFRAVNTKLDKLWKINRLGALKSQIIFNAFIVPWRKYVIFEPFEKKVSNQIEKLIIKDKALACVRVL